MRKPLRLLGGLFVVSALMAVPTVFARMAPQTPQALRVLEPVAGTMAVPNPRSGAAAVSGAPVQVRFDLIAQAAASGGAIEIPLTNGVVATARITHAEVNGTQMFVAGPLENGQSGEASFTTVGDILVGRVVVGRRLFMVRRAPNSLLHVVTEIDPAMFPRDSEPVNPDGLAPGAPAGASGVAVGASAASDSGQFVDIMVLYTNAAMSYWGSEAAIQADVVAAVNNGNLALQNSGLTYRFRLVHQELTSYTEVSADFSTDLTNLRTGVVPNVAALRDQYAADTVTLIGRYTGANCGLGYVMGSGSISVSAMAPFAFNVVGDICANGNLSLAHETGHNMGLAHDRYVAGSNPAHAFPYAFGYIASNLLGRDVMAYPDGCSGCPRLAIYSTPLAYFPGVSPLTYAGVPDSPGSTTSADNTLALSQTMPVVANFRVSSACTFTLSPTTATSYTAAGGSGSVSVTASDPSCAWTVAPSDTSMLSITAGSSGTGSGTVSYAVSVNSGVGRSATLTVGGQTVTITEEAACSVVSLSPGSATVARSGGTGTVSVTIAASCAWSASSNATSVATIVTGASGLGSGTVSYSVSGNSGTLTTRTATLTIAGQAFVITQNGYALSLTPAALRFGATKAGGTGALLAVTAPQTVTVAFDGAGSSAWSVAANQPWVQISGGSGTNGGQFTVGIVNPNNVLSTSTSLTATITLTATNVTNSGLTLPIALTIDQTGGASTSPAFGQVDTPVQGATAVVGAIGVTGWVIDDVGVSGVKIYRNCLSFENQASCQVIQGNNVVFVGDAAFVAGARPDVEAAFPTFPASNVAGWGYLLLTNMLPRTTGTAAAYGGQGSLTLYAFATDLDGHTTLLGRSQNDHTPTAITMDNDNIVKPFGAIDTPSQGGTVSGTFANFGWVLTPDLDTTANSSDILMATDGSTMNVFIDGVSKGAVAYNQCRGNVGNPVPAGLYCNDDVASIFGNLTPQATFTTRTSNPTRYRNLDVTRSAIGAFNIDTTTLTNGMHSIAWGVSDSAGRQEGIGSRNFFVLNAGADAPADAAVAALLAAPVQPRGDVASLPANVRSGAQIAGRAGFDLTSPFEVVTADAAGVRHVQIPDMGRIELSLDGPVDAGYLIVGDTLRDLPIGSHLDGATGVFTWAPVPGFLGTYHLVFVQAGQRVPVDVTVRPMEAAAAGESEIRMNVDLPIAGATVSGSVMIAGWALDPQAWTGSGIDAIHVWAYRRDAPSTGPQFLGAADLHALRPDVAQAFGAAFDRAGFGLVTTALAPGEYDLVVYAWCERTARWEDARTVHVSVR